MRLLIHDYAGHPFEVQLSRELAGRGHVVVHAYAGNLITPRGPLQKRQDDPAGFEVVEVSMSPEYRASKYSFLKRRGLEVAYGRELAVLLERVRPDVVISGNTPTEPQWTMIRAAQRLAIPVVSWIQDFYSAAVDKLARKRLPLIGGWMGRRYRHLDGKCFHASAGIVAITEDFLPILAGFGVPADHVTVIPNWAPLDELPPRPRRNAWAVRHGCGDGFVFLYAGTLAMKHNPSLLRRLAVHFRDDPAVRVVIVSEGPGADYLRERKVAEKLVNLDILPYQPFADMPDVLGTADVLVAVLESDAGVFSVPSKVLTYHCAARPILAAIPEQNLAARIIRRQKSGTCVDPRDEDGFVAAADAMRHDAAARAAMARRGRAYAEAEFDIGRIADRFEVVIERAAGTARSIPEG